MFDTASLVIFITATLALLLAPGPAVLYIVARSLEQGRIAGIVSALGIALGAVVHVIFAAFGLSALLMQSAMVFSLVKYMGAAYLIYIGIQTLRKKTEVNEVTEIQTMTYSRIFKQGFVVNLLNPKTALFFLAFLPQFVDAERGGVGIQIILLGTIFVGLAIVSDSLYALIAGTARQLLTGSIMMIRSQKYMSGSIYILLGLMTAFSGDSKSAG
ncbi:LysE family translocator [Anaerolineales bacterium HSG24]|nr:LysE family translocator [Anaerolineales bacterium HSG24]